MLIVAAAYFTVYSAFKNGLSIPLYFGAIFYVTVRGFPISLALIGFIVAALAVVIRLLLSEIAVDAVRALWASRTRAFFSLSVAALLASWGVYEFRYSAFFASATGSEIVQKLTKAAVLSRNGKAFFQELDLGAIRYCVAPEKAPVVTAASMLIPGKPITFVEGEGTLLPKWHVILEFDREVEIYMIQQQLLRWRVPKDSDWREQTNCWKGVLIDEENRIVRFLS